MRKLIMWNVVTLDNRFEGEKPWDLSFHELVWGPELETFVDQQLGKIDMIVFGENTYKGMAEYWSTEKGKTADMMNSVKKIVCSETREKADWNNTTIVKDAVSGIQKLKNEGDGTMFVFGSGILSQSLMNAGLFDEIRLCVAPIILGKGRRLFTDEIQKQNLKLIESQTLSTGGVILKYIVTKN
jgi:dihydrofolate reductase